MARFEIANCEMVTLGQGPASADVFYRLGIQHSVGGTAAADMIAAHKWFNIAAMKGCKEAIELRQEIAANMSPSDIAAAQRAARDWLTAH